MGTKSHHLGLGFLLLLFLPAGMNQLSPDTAALPVDPKPPLLQLPLQRLLRTGECEEGVLKRKETCLMRWVMVLGSSHVKSQVWPQTLITPVL